ncbi:DMT family transporter [Alkalihalobacillus macyae]|uniref:DMT family transporter n=1 Tax=Guptibacillus hwajinpoensis TaxID=208199 RepID=UPI00273BF065|nr:DMT family transporter [Alkalihalobacillus macyae]MDP4553404.1 DMT family transporter [Alkalihalobacillus macyae]
MRNWDLYYLAYLSLGIIWGTNFLFMKWAAVLINPEQIVFLRVLSGFIPVVGYALMKKQLKLKHFKHAHHFLVMSILATVIYFYCFAKGTALLNSGIAGALSGSIPLFSTLITFLLLKEEKLSKWKIAGVFAGFIGVLLIAKPWVNGEASLNLSGVLYMTIGSLSVGISFVYAKRFLSHINISPAALTSYQMILALVIVGLFGDLKGIGDIQTDLGALLGVIIGLGIVGTGIAYILYYVIVNRLGAVVASTVTYIPPVVALFIGLFLANEVILLSDWGGMVVILIGVYLLNKKSKNRTNKIVEIKR